METAKGASNLLGIEFENFDKESKMQLFIDRESFAVVSEGERSSDDSNLMGSVHSYTETKESKVRQMCTLLSEPGHRRSEEKLLKILPYFKELEAF